MKNYLAGLLMGLVLISCGGNPSQQEQVQSPTSTTSTEDTEDTFIYVNSNDQRNIGSITLGSVGIVQADNQRLTISTKPDKTKFINEAGETLYTAKIDADGFKIKSGDRLVMKVKWSYENKIKLSDNNEMESAYEIKINENDKIKVIQNEVVLEEYKLSYDTNKEWMAKDFRFSGLGKSVSSGLMFVPLGSNLEKMIAMALLKRADK